MEVYVLVVFYQGLVDTVIPFRTMAGAEREWERRFDQLYDEENLPSPDSDHAGSGIWAAEVIEQ